MTPNDAIIRPVALSELRKGSLFAGKYRIDRLLGEGGMGCVWAATNLVLDTAVAIKVLHAELESEETEERMLWEARSAAKLKHPAIIQVFDFGRTQEGRAFMAMELLEGRSLGDMLAEQSIPPETAIQLILPVAGALVVAHEQGIVHRDLKPDNIFLSENASGTVQPKILDFGIAKVDRGVDKRTVNGEVLGSPEYMSPEQARGLPSVDARSDVWALAIVIYELLTGKVPFTGDNYNAVMCAILETEPVPIQRHGVHDDKLWQLIAKGLRKDPNRRYASMKEFGEALAQWLWDRGIREDACHKALDTDWLGGSRMGVRLFSGATLREEWEEQTEIRGQPDVESLQPVSAAKPPSLRWRLGASTVALVGLMVSMGGWLARRQDAAFLPPALSSLIPPETSPEKSQRIIHTETRTLGAGQASAAAAVAPMSAAMQSSALEPEQSTGSAYTSSSGNTSEPASSLNASEPTSAPEPTAPSNTSENQSPGDSQRASAPAAPKPARRKAKAKRANRRRRSRPRKRTSPPSTDETRSSDKTPSTHRRDEKASAPAPHERDLKTPW